MHSTKKAIIKEFFVAGRKVTATIDLSSGHAQPRFHWEPFPNRLNHRLKVEYRKKRDAVMQEAADEIGEIILLVDDFDKAHFLFTTFEPGKPIQTKRFQKNAV
jgi:hypothetical protein